MAREKPDDVKKELEELEDENYGDETISGTNPRPDADDDVEEFMEDVVGGDFEEEKPFSLAEEVEEDEKDIQNDEINDYMPDPEDAKEEEPESELEKVVRKEGLTTDDPMNQVSDNDFGDEEEDSE